MSSPSSTALDILDLHLINVMMMETWFARHGTERRSSSFLMWSNSTLLASECPSSCETTKTTKSWLSAKAPIQSSRSVSNRTRTHLRQRSNSWMTLPRLVYVHFWSPAKRLLKNTTTNGLLNTSKLPHLRIRRKRWIECQTSWSRSSTYSDQLQLKTNCKKMWVRPSMTCDRPM